MDEEEVEGVIAHELAHVQNRDILIASVAATIAGAVSMLAHFAQWGAIFGGMGRAARTSAAATRWFSCSPRLRPHRGADHPDGDLALPGVRGGRHRGSHRREPPRLARALRSSGR